MRAVFRVGPSHRLPGLELLPVLDLSVYSVGNGLHQVLKVREKVGVGFVAVFTYHFPIDYHVKLAVGTRC